MSLWRLISNKSIISRPRPYYRPRPVPVPFYRRPVYPPSPYSEYFPQYNSFARPPSSPQINNRIVIHGAPTQGYRPRPVPVYSGNQPGQFVGYRRPVRPGQVVRVNPTKNQKVKPNKKKPVKKPTPVEHQDDDVYAYEPTLTLDDVSVGVDSSGSVDSYEQQVPQQRQREVSRTQPQVQVVTKSRRNPKMAKKPKTNKKVVEQKKTVTNPDPLNMFKKLNTKSRRN